ncbi:MAG: DUF72 domain-containing protein [Anaerolineae bacterium]
MIYFGTSGFDYLVAEFRNRDWLREEMFDFHGRNAAKWWQHEEAWQRYDYTYRPEELQEWLPKLRALDEEAESVYVYSNNHWQGQAVDTATQLRLML